LRKRRTRSHIIADLSVNHFERHALLCGYTVERVEHDYGVDLILYTYDANGEPESDAISIQMKATDHLTILEDQQTIAFVVEQADLDSWLAQTMPLILILYDAVAEIAYWLYIQAYFTRQLGFDVARTGKTVTVHVPKSNVVDQAAIRRFAEFKADVARQTKGAVHHHE
jgi:hypothetical protein